MPDYAYVRATEQGPWHIVQLGYPGAVFDQPICGSVLCYETWSTEPVTDEISHEARTPLCESCLTAYSGLVLLPILPVRKKDTANAAGIDFSRLQATCIKSDSICWQCDQLRQLIDVLVWDKAEYLNHAGQWAPTGALTCHFCGVVKGHPHSETCRAKGIAE